MCSVSAALQTAQQQLLQRMGGCSLDDLATSLPSIHNTDVHLLCGEEILVELSETGTQRSCAELDVVMWEVFHKFSLTHSTLYHHRLQQNTLRNNRRAVKEQRQLSRLERRLEVVRAKLSVDAAETRARVEALPPGWVVVQVTVGVNSEARLRRVWQDTFKLHVTRVSTGPNRPPPVVQTLVKCDGSLLLELDRIKEQNRVLNKEFANDAAKYSAMRDILDASLKSVVAGLEAAWLGVWRCLLLGNCTQRDAVATMVRRVAAAAHIQFDTQQVEKMVCVLCCDAVTLSAYDEPSPVLGASYQLKPVVARIAGENVRSEKIQHLVTLLRENRACIDAARRARPGPVILILDKMVAAMPWESTSCLKDQPVTRMPSLHSLHALYQVHSSSADSVLARGLDGRSGYYLLDPENNLPRSQQRLADAFKNTGWSGVCGERPSYKQFKDALAQKDIFMYVGHGSGSQYLPGELVEEVSCQAAVMLYGCSSVKLMPRGLLPDPWGVLLNYLLADCPCLLGMLYDVTDKDTDLLTAEMLSRVTAATSAGGLAGPRDVATLVARSRPLCHRYITGAAMIVYGLPLSLAREAATNGASEDTRPIQRDL